MDKLELTVGCLREMGQRASEAVTGTNRLLPARSSRKKALAAEANEDGPWRSAKESQLIRVPTARIPVVDFGRTIVFGREKKREKKTRKIIECKRARRQGLSTSELLASSGS